jgi:hypothetical protein
VLIATIRKGHDRTVSVVHLRSQLDFLDYETNEVNHQVNIEVLEIFVESLMEGFPGRSEEEKFFSRPPRGKSLVAVHIII